jgi:hypothetical protein
VTYQRVIPRDLFNEAKLLKCLGQLALLIHEGRGIRWPIRLEEEDGGAPFAIELDAENHGLAAPGLRLVVRLPGAEEPAEVYLYSPYNSKKPYPLHFVPPDEYGDIGNVFNDDGTLSREFCACLDRLAPPQPH